MGTNYYVSTGKQEKVICDCGFEHLIEEKLHIGKYSCGWKFCLHIIPEKGINELSDWKPFLKNGTIKDEYDREVDYDTMIDLITNIKYEYHSNEEIHYDCFLDTNDNLLFTKYDKLGKEGTYVLVEGDFS